MNKIFLDTNVYIIGQLKPDSQEEIILQWLGFFNSIKQSQIKIIISKELINQILRVSKRVKGKDWGSKIVDQIWQNLDCLFIPETDEMNVKANELLANQLIPREDIYIYLTALLGEADCFISSNRELIKAIADFECLTPNDFINKYL